MTSICRAAVLLLLCGTVAWATPPSDAKPAATKKDTKKRKELSADAKSAAATLKNAAAKNAVNTDDCTWGCLQALRGCLRQCGQPHRSCSDCPKHYDSCEASCSSAESRAAAPSDCEVEALDVFAMCIHDKPANKGECRKALDTALQNCARCGDIICE